MGPDWQPSLPRASGSSHWLRLGRRRGRRARRGAGRLPVGRGCHLPRCRSGEAREDARPAAWVHRAVWRLGSRRQPVCIADRRPGHRLRHQHRRQHSGTTRGKRGDRDRLQHRRQQTGDRRPVGCRRHGRPGDARAARQAGAARGRTLRCHARAGQPHGIRRDGAAEVGLGVLARSLFGLGSRGSRVGFGSRPRRHGLGRHRPDRLLTGCRSCGDRHRRRLGRARPGDRPAGASTRHCSRPHRSLTRLLAGRQPPS